MTSPRPRRWLVWSFGLALAGVSGCFFIGFADGYIDGTIDNVVFGPPPGTTASSSSSRPPTSRVTGASSRRPASSTGTRADAGPPCGGTDCFPCTAEAVCGWCRDTNSCAQGSESGPFSGACPADGWVWHPADC